MKPTLLYDPEDTETRLYNQLQGVVSGIRNFCSGAVMSAFQSNYMGRPDLMLKNPAPKEYKECETLLEYSKHYGTGGSTLLRGCYAVPEELAYLFFLESVYNKAEFGDDDQPNVVNKGERYDMWSRGEWRAKTWFIADRMTGRQFPDEHLSCAKFMRFFSAPGMGHTYGRMVCSPLADGAHGGQCSGGVWVPNLPYLREQLDQAITDVNSHAKALVDIYGVQQGPADPVARLY